MTQKWTAADLADQTGKTFVITGATGGIGLETTRELLRAGANVVMAVRNPAKGAEVARSLGRTRGQIDVRALDVSDLSSVQAFAASWSGRIDVLINNAGIMMVPHALTADGFETQMATNYLGPFALTNALLPHLTGRVVSIASQLHRLGRPGLTSRRHTPATAYYDSKINILLFSYELQRRLQAAGSPVISVVAHPGIARTNIVTHVGGFPGWLNGLAQPLLNDAEHGALPTLYAATCDVTPNAYVGPDSPGSIRGNPAVRNPSRTAHNPKAAATLWDETLAAVGKQYAFPL